MELQPSSTQHEIKSDHANLNDRITEEAEEMEIKT